MTNDERICFLLEAILERLVKLEEKMTPKTVNTTPKNGLVEIEVYKQGIRVFGDTLIHKEKIKSFGGKWNPSLKSWIMSKESGQQFGMYMRENFPSGVEAPGSVFI